MLEDEDHVGVESVAPLLELPWDVAVGDLRLRHPVLEDMAEVDDLVPLENLL